nr:dynamin family protein [Ornithinibacillus caprae]
MNREFVVSFAGHFSAGKSSMINALLGKELLPKSPIPTSANIVKINSGQGVARVYFHKEKPIEYDEPYDMEMIKKYCKDKDTIKRIELSTGDDLIPFGCSIIDTPGIDAADDADRIITESSLHLVDVLFYVMDYNHVQSEVNLYFLKNIQDIGIPYYIIINQVDKHDEQEIPFTTYESNIKQTFEQWGLAPTKMYYSSLMDSNTSHNQYHLIKEQLFQHFTDHETYIRTVGATNQIIEEHKKYLKQSFEEKLKHVSLGSEDAEDITKRLKAVTNSIEKISQERKEIETTFQDNVHSTLKNAYIMPSSLRDQAGKFLESRQKDFKVGLFGSKKKTEQEQQERLNEFLTELQKSIEANIQWKLREKCNSILQQFNVINSNLLEQTQQLSIDYNEEDLLSHVKSGAKLNGDYILNYTNEVSTDIKNKFKQKTKLLWEEIHQVVDNDFHTKRQSYEEERSQIQESMKELNEYATIQDTLQKKLDLLTNPPKITETSRELILARMQDSEIKPIKMDSQEMKIIGTTTNVNKTTEANSSVSESNYSTEAISRIIDQTTQTVENLPGFRSLIGDLKKKQDRLINRSLTISLFGAFSAGKSSFANALLGEGVLPVSPNPTTAVINRINPVSDTFSHGTVVIQLKDEQTITNDIQTITKHLSPPTADLSTLIQWIDQNEIYHSNELNHLYQSYLMALYKGYGDHNDVIGKEIIISIEDFASYVTDEKKACYIETIDLYYDCSLTQQGITLVDTPGADSINARHTNVAFDYIKYADAIIYVSYYNHALSRADKDFLMQLGRVKEAFQLDKMFFIINAADLAESDSDLKLVKDYVEEQLLQLGIRFPQIYPVSSKQSLEDKRDQRILNDQMALFEDNLYDFIHNGLATLSIEGALYDMKRIQRTLTSFIETASLNEHEKEQHRKELINKKEQLLEIANYSTHSVYEERVQEKIAKQLHYVEERLSIRYHDMFKERFNPTTVTESGRKATVQLEQNTKQLLDYVGYELLQEVRAVSLRIEAFLFDVLKEYHGEVRNQMQRIDSTFLLPNVEKFDLTTPEYDQALTNVDMNLFSKALSMFKGTKAFFERNEKENMKEEIFTILLPKVRTYLQKIETIMGRVYTEQWQKEVEQHNKRIITEIMGYIDEHLALMTDHVDLDLLKEKQDTLYAILNKENEEEK